MADTTKKKKWIVNHRSRGEFTIEADNAKRTGAGTYFYNGDDYTEQQVASFQDGVITEFYPAS